MQIEFFTKQVSSIPHRKNENIFITGGVGYGEYGLTMACVEVVKIDKIPIGLVSRTIPSNKYVVFTYEGNAHPEKVGPIELAPMYDYVYGTWLKNSDYEVLDSFSFELWDMNNACDSYCKAELYIPIR